MTRLPVFLVLLFPFAGASAQATPPRTAPDSVLAVVTRLFDGMKARDTTLMRSLFVPGAQFGGVPTGQQPVPFSTLDAWLTSIGRAPAGMVLEEELHQPEVRIDGGLATVWTEYTFRVDGRVSHCGFDAFQIVRTTGGWKIMFVSDTRRTTGCRS